ncbi:MAG: universal stress protein [Flavobacteriales bacterium]|nr:universal stress protein [Flavobacteriales bacterium]
MKKILVPTDFSILADYAVHYAMKLAKEFNASIILYHSFIPFESGFYPLAQSKKENKETEDNLIKRLAKIKDELLKSNKNVPVSVHVDRGPESFQLVEFCKKKKIDLIVMGTKGASGLKEVVIGSFTADTMTKAPCPVLAIPQKCKFKIPKKITFASNYHKKDIQSIKLLLKWNEPFKAKINILHIDDGELIPAAEEEVFGNYKRKIEKQCEDISLSFQHIDGKDISKAILHITLNDKTDILSLSPIKREGIWTRLFHKSITKTTAYHLRMPVLTIPIK